MEIRCRRYSGEWWLCCAAFRAVYGVVSSVELEAMLLRIAVARGLCGDVAVEYGAGVLRVDGTSGEGLWVEMSFASESDCAS